jgi:hypothetical protein
MSYYRADHGREHQLVAVLHLLPRVVGSPRRRAAAAGVAPVTLSLSGNFGGRGFWFERRSEEKTTLAATPLFRARTEHCVVSRVQTGSLGTCNAGSGR